MSVPARWLLRFLLATAVGATGLATLGYLLARSRLPQVDGRLLLPGLSAEVRVRRDHLGVPHVDAQSEADAWSAIGFVHAQDRFFQMDLARRAVAGRLSEIFGRRALGLDQDARKSRLAATAAAHLSQLPTEDRAMLDAYVRGVNAGLASTGGPVEAVLLHYQPQPWTALDSLLVVTYMEDLLAVDGGELQRADLAAAVGRDVAAYLFDFEGMTGATVLDDGQLAEPEPSPSAPATVPTGSHDSDADAPTHGSNSWAISGKRTRSGQPLFANDTHLPATTPAIFYQAHVRFPGVDTVGMTLPGAPYPVLGHNAHVAWGLTVLMADQVDYAHLEIDPLDSSRYRTSVGWSTLEITRETIGVRGGDDATVEVRATPFGPVVEVGGQAYVRLWTADRVGHTLTAGRVFQRCTSVSELLDAARDFTGPGMNLVAADVSGHIGYRAAAAIPDRTSGDGRYPVELSAGEPWRGLVAPEAMPRSLDPERGYLVSANNRIGTSAMAMQVGSWWAEPWRADRIVEAIDANNPQDVESCQRIQLDDTSARARDLLAALPQEIVDPAAAPYWRRLQAWDRRFDRGIEPTLYEVFERNLLQAIFADEVQSKWPEARRGLLKALRVRSFSAVDPAIAGRDWIDDQSTPQRETIGDRVAQSVNAAVAELRGTFGDDQDAWRWERLHTLSPAHPLAALPGVGRLFAIGPSPITGTGHTVSATSGRQKRRFQVDHIPAFRMVVDLGDLRRSRIVNSTGQSGHFLSRHYSDQFDDFTAGRYHPMLYAEEDVAAKTESTLMLHP